MSEGLQFWMEWYFTIGTVLTVISIIVATGIACYVLWKLFKLRKPKSD